MIRRPGVWVRRARGLGVALAVLGGLTLAGLSAAAQEAVREPAAPVVLRVGWLGEPDSLNPWLAYTDQARWVLRLVYEPLVGYDERLRPAPALAVQWSRDAEGREWTFRLREGVRWHDGRPVTSTDVKFTLEYAAAGAFGLYAPYLRELVTPVETPDALTVVVRFRSPQAWMPELPLPVVPRHLWSEVAPEQARTALAAPVPHVGSGAFRLAEYAPGSHVRLVANRQHWSGGPAIDELHFLRYADEGALDQALRNGAVDLVLDVPPARFAALREVPGVATASSSANALWEVAYNTWQDPTRSKGHPALRDRRVRQALDLAIDRRRIVAEALHGLAVEGDSVLPPVLAYWRWQPPADVRRGYDPERGRQLLEEAGWRDRDGDGVREDAGGRPLALRLHILATQPEAPAVAEILRAGWAAIGVRVTVAAAEDGALQERILAADYDAVFWGWGGDPDPSSLLSVFSTGQIGGLSDSFYQNPEFDRLFQEQLGEVDRERRRELVHRLQQLIYEDVPYSVLYYPAVLQAYRADRWTGWRPLATGALTSPLQPDGFLHVRPVPPPPPAERAAGAPARVLVPVAAVTALFALWRLLRRRGGPPAAPGAAA